MRLQLIRNATLLLDYAGKRILTDPYFAPKHSLRSFTGRSPNPMVDLPLAPEAIVQDVELVIVSHLHTDHFDAAAQEALPKDVPVMCQPGDETTIREKGFVDVTPVTDLVDWHGISVQRTDGHHGTGEIEQMMKNVSGFVLSAKGEPRLYWAGDTILCSEVRDILEQVEPDVVVTHSSGAVWPDSAGTNQLIIMDAAQTIEVCRLASNAVVVAVHMEVSDHETITRAALRATANAAGNSEQRLCIPNDGEAVDF